MSAMIVCGGNQPAGGVVCGDQAGAGMGAGVRAEQRVVAGGGGFDDVVGGIEAGLCEGHPVLVGDAGFGAVGGCGGVSP